MGEGVFAYACLCRDQLPGVILSLSIIVLSECPIVPGA